jgi:hypothetical protein
VSPGQTNARPVVHLFGCVCLESTSTTSRLSLHVDRFMNYLLCFSRGTPPGISSKAPRGKGDPKGGIQLYDTSQSE